MAPLSQKKDKARSVSWGVHLQRVVRTAAGTGADEGAPEAGAVGAVLRVAPQWGQASPTRCAEWTGALPVGGGAMEKKGETGGVQKNCSPNMHTTRSLGQGFLTLTRHHVSPEAGGLDHGNFPCPRGISPTLQCSVQLRRGPEELERTKKKRLIEMRKAKRKRCLRFRPTLAWPWSWTQGPRTKAVGTLREVSTFNFAKWQICCRKGDPFQGPKLGSCLTLRN